MDRRGCVVMAVALAVTALGLGGAAHRVAAEDAAPDSLEALMTAFAASGGVRARFREARYLSLLDQPLESAGELYFAPPDRLARRTTQPGLARVVVRGDRVAFQDELGHQTLDLASSEVARGLVGNLRVLLRGDAVELRERYDARFTPEDGGWLLELEPRSRVLRSLVEAIRVRGQGREMTEIETREASGDRTVLTLVAVETGVVFSEVEAEQIFSLVAAPLGAATSPAP